MLRPPRHARTWLSIATLALSIGCKAEIGDSCSVGTDCSQTGSRTCDTKMPDGYCTIYSCLHDTCPDEAACIGFMVSQSTAKECLETSNRNRLRTFCMRKCSSDGDCRSGYSCLDLNAPNNPWNSVLVDENQSHSKVCTLDYAAMPAVENKTSKADFCTAGTFEDNGYYDVSSGGAGGSSSGSSSPTTGGSTGSGGESSKLSTSTVQGGATMVTGT